jgi:hypothetical protein
MGKNYNSSRLVNGLSVDASGNVGVGGSPSGSFKLDVNGNSKVLNNLTISSTTNAALIAATNSTTGYTYIDIINNGASGRNYQIGVGGNGAASGYANNLYFDLVGVGNIMTLTSGRNVGIGTNSPGYLLDVINGSNPSLRVRNAALGGSATLLLETANDFTGTCQAYVRVLGSTGNGQSTLTFGTAGAISDTTATERMRITSGGDVIVGGTATAGLQRSVTTNASNNSGFVIQTGGTNKGYLYCDNANTYLESTTSGRIYCWVNGANGVYLTAGSTSWTANSDERLKNITGNIENAIESLLTLRTVKHTWKSDENKIERLGLIAQDVEKVFPQVIEKYQIPAGREQQQTDETEYLGVKYTELIPVLVKAIQELKAEVDSLKAQINN